MADGIATGQVTCGESRTYDDNGQACRGLAWVLYDPASPEDPEGPQEEWAVDNLSAHPMRVANKCHDEQQGHEVRMSTLPVIRRLNDLHEGGINEKITYSYWENRALRRHVRTILLAQSQCHRTWTQKWIHKVLPE